MYLKVLVDAPQLRHELQPGDVVTAGVVISNSETGQGSLSVQPLIYRLVCRNGLIVADHSMRKTHVGRLSEVSTEEVTIFRADTLAADDAAFFLKVRDVVQASVSEATFRLFAEKMRSTLGIKLLGDPVHAIEKLETRYLLNDDERAGVLRTLITEADLSAFGLINAVTGFAQEVQSYDRSTELEAIGGKMLEHSRSEWDALAETA
jgi:RNA-splicing ligase RtcB